MKKKTAKKKTKPVQNVIKNSTFTGVHWDAKACEAIEKVADGLLQNARGLSSLAALFHTQNIDIECLIKLVDGEPQSPLKPKARKEAKSQ